MLEERPDRRQSDPVRARNSDRRDSPRLLMAFQVRDEEGLPFAHREGDVSVGGAFYAADNPPLTRLVDLVLSLPVSPMCDAATIRCRASVVRTTRQPDGRWGVHLAFKDMAVEDEQRLARFIDSYLLAKGEG